jgi:hypothetical protein
MAHERHEPSGNEAWDAYGAWLGHAGAIGQAISKRYLQVWSEVSSNLRAGPYTSEQAAADSRRMWEAGWANALDMGRLWTAVPEARAVADELPTAFVNFEFVAFEGTGGFTLPGPVHVAMPKGLDKPPAQGWVRFAGHQPWPKKPKRTPAKTTEINPGEAPESVNATIANLEGAIHVDLTERADGYLVSLTQPRGYLVPGLYVGGVFLNLGRGKAQLAHLSVLIDAPSGNPAIA